MSLIRCELIEIKFCKSRRLYANSFIPFINKWCFKTCNCSCCRTLLISYNHPHLQPQTWYTTYPMFRWVEVLWDSGRESGPDKLYLVRIVSTAITRKFGSSISLCLNKWFRTTTFIPVRYYFCIVIPKISVFVIKTL